jgi:hypothetical protein
MIELGRQEIVQQFRTYLAPFRRAVSVIENQTAGILPRDRQTLAVSKLGGWKVRVRSGDYLKFDLHSITLFWNTSATVDVKVYNLLTGNLLDTFSVNAQANMPTEKIVSKSYQGNDILLGIVTAGSGQPFRVDSSGCATCPHKTEYVWMTPGEIDSGDAITDANMDSASHAYGMQLNYSVSCDIEPFICNMSPELAWPLMEASAAQVFTTVLGEMERWNTYVTINRSKAEFWQQYHQGRFEQSMKDILRNMVVPECACFSCNSFIRKRTQIP